MGRRHWPAGPAQACHALLAAVSAMSSAAWWTKAGTVSWRRPCTVVRNAVLMLLTFHAGSDAVARDVYVAPKMNGYTVTSSGTVPSNNIGTSGSVVFFNSPQEAIQFKLSEIQANTGQVPCPAGIYSNPGPSPVASAPNQTFLNGTASLWGLDVAWVDTSVPGCQRQPVTWGGTWAYLSPACPEDSGGVNVKQLSATEFIAYCVIRVPDQEPCASCTTPNPVLISRGEKTLWETDYTGLTGLDYRRVYRSRDRRFWTDQAQVLFNLLGVGAGPGCLPAAYWRPGSEAVQDHYCFPFISIDVQEYSIPDGAGVYVKFTGSPDAPVTTPDVIDRAVRVTDAQSGFVWRVKRKNNTMQIYDASGLQRQTVRHDGRAVTSTYVDGVMTTQADAFGRTMQWEYHPKSRAVARMTDPAGGVYDYAYDGGLNLTTVTYPPDAAGVRAVKTYHYDRSIGLGPFGRLFRYLTGVTDESGHRWSTFAYDDHGRVTSTRLHPSAGVDANVYTFVYNGYPVVTDPLGATRTYGVLSILNRDVIASVSQPGGSGSSAATRSATYDSQRNVTSQDDYKGQRTCYANDLTRNLETVRVMGLSTATACSSVTVLNAALPVGSRKVSTQWHPDWRLEKKVAEPGRMVTSVYNGQPDPFNGNALANCAPPDALLPDGTPIAVLCKRVEQATSDANGAAGFGATLQPGVASRAVSWTYNRHGQVLTEDGPRTDINDVTTYTYHSDMTSDHLPGDLSTMTDPGGRVTQYTRYNRHGQLLESTDPNGVVTVLTYDERMRLTSLTVAGATTVYTYDPIGQLVRLTLPDGSWAGYDYDGARRQTAVYDHRGNRIDYVLDNAGNRIGENTKDPSGALKRQLARSIDALGRVQQTIGRD